MGGKGSGRLSLTDSILKKTTQNFTPIASGEMFMPNHSGDHSAGNTGTPTSDFHIANKKYVDDAIDPLPSLSGDNTWTGTNTFEDDVTLEKEVKGTKHSTVFSQNDEIQIGFIADKFIELGGVELSTSKGMTTLTAGSVVGVTVNYDCTAVAKVSGLQIQVMKNGSRVWNNNLVTVTGTNKRFEFTQARDEDSFVAGDFLGISFAASGVAGTIDIEKVIVELIYYYDD